MELQAKLKGLNFLLEHVMRTIVDSINAMTILPFIALDILIVIGVSSFL